ncbi:MULTISPECIES: hypothetical protein [unclassified Streptomyces]|uniref:hypothetical protein n=1 Tax=unclassified Streptomyces TaxID=2593676 RepID=UPI00166058AA|nr:MULTISPECIES: hypothetical protein [unclassified Streptomyces]MBD0710198.1 hypothetical protein [Streptomyces sp. CBMA291]MBD0712923.1 hypothetical protein [Streptomyces sp. CBMA370]
MNHADGTAPIYAELIRERGDVPADVRQVAEQVLRDLSRYIQVPPQPVPGAQGAAPQQGGVPHPGMGGPMGVGGPVGVVGQAAAVMPHRPLR